MREAQIAILIFVCLVVASLGSMLTHERLPTRHRQDDTTGVVRLVANIFVVMTSLVMGLMLNSARNTFEQIDHNVHDYATQLILLDRALRDYGSEAEDARQPLIAYVQRIVDNETRPSNEPATVANKLSERLIGEIGSRLRNLKPVNAEQTVLWQDARQNLQKVIELRWTLIERSEGTIPRLLIVMLVAWLVLVFASFGFRAPRNAVVVTTFIASSALLAASLYLVLDMDVPFDGPIQVSPAPLERALAELKN
ncbi:DUF4239 domain-containing protein [Aminobacter sp. LjRoot7]|uniref:bestrophin-like domain n=1 Tax=Aminobacter sp. LjRoot7 TaxID=3342335 RepID=UPI003ED0A441